MMFDEIAEVDIPLYKIYGVDAKAYRHIIISESDVSIRVKNCFGRAGVRTLEEVLLMSKEDIGKFRQFGLRSYYDLRAYLDKTIKRDNVLPTSQSQSMHLLSEMNNIILSGSVNPLVSKDLTKQDYEFIDLINSICELIGRDEAYQFKSNHVYTSILADVLTKFSKKIENKEKASGVLTKMPRYRREMILGDVLDAYTSDKELKYRLLGNEDENESLQEYVTNTIGNYYFDIALSKFIDWCTISSSELAEAFFAEGKVNEKMIDIVCLRASGMTLEQVGNEYGVTRERIRQIEARTIREFTHWLEKSHLLSLVRIDFHDRSFLRYDELVSVMGKYGKVITYLLIVCESQNGVSFGSIYKAFILCDKENLNQVMNIVECLPERFCSTRIDELCPDRIPRDLFMLVLENSYKKTGDWYHRNRLTISSVCRDILSRFFKEGIRVYDSAELAKFRKVVKREYGEIGLSASDRALTARLTDIGVLAGRGIYKPKQDKYISDELSKSLYEYIINSEAPACLTNVLFASFADRLVSEGVDNKYYLQGVLREIYGDRLFFRRDYIAKDSTFTNAYASICKFIKEARRPVSKQEIYNSFPGITEIVISFAVDEYDILNLYGTYMHISNLDLSEEEKEYLHSILDKFVENGATVHSKSIFNYIINENRHILSRNYIIHPFSMYSLLESLFHDDFNFSRPYISQTNVEIERTNETLLNIVENSDYSFLDEISTLARQNHFQIYSLLEFANSCNETHLLMSSNELVAIETIGVDEKIAAQVERIICETISGTMPIISLSCIHLFPKINVSWNEWLIYSVLKKWSSKLEVGMTSNQIRTATPLVAKAGELVDECFSNMGGNRNGSVCIADNMDDIDLLIEDIISEEMEL